ncbi:MAG: hypothetical protein MJA29_14285, partial [Candidatus Omnitrophica bacterium]|nr:hypothetical protein [Candidatus Omnitrophota bacterium]
MNELLEQFAVLDSLLNNWPAIQIRSGIDEPGFQNELARIASRLTSASNSENIAVVLDDLLDLIEETPAYAYVEELISRSRYETDSSSKTRSLSSSKGNDLLENNPLITE